MKSFLNDKLSVALFLIVLITIAYMFFALATGRFDQHKSWVYSVDRNKQNIISASQNEILIWNGRRCTDRLVNHTDAIKTVSFSHNGKMFVSGSNDKTIKIWSLQNKKVVQTLYGHTAGVNKVEFDTSDTYIISAGYDNRLFIWNWKKDKKIKEFDIKHTSFSISNSNVLAYVDSACILNLFDLTSLSPIKTVDKYCGAPIFIPHTSIIAVNEINKSIFTFVDIH